MNGFGKDNPQQINVPAFTSTGGITPQQQTLANFTYGQNELAQGGLFGGEGLGDSTMATQGAEGAANTRAQAEGSMSDTDQEAQYALYQNDLSALDQNLKNQIALQGNNSTSLSSLAGLASGLGTGTAASLGGTAASGASDATLASDFLAAGVV